MFQILFKVLSLLEALFDLISSPSHTMKIQIMGGKILQVGDLNRGRNDSVRKIQIN